MTLPEDEVLTCRECGEEAGIVPLVPGLLTLGHKTNPTFRSHYVRLARPADGAPAALHSRMARREDIHRQAEGPNSTRQVGGEITRATVGRSGGPSHRPAPVSAGRSVPGVSMRVDSVAQPSGQRALTSSRPPRSSTPRAALTARQRP